jgi:hypothetical protein
MSANASIGGWIGLSRETRAFREKVSNKLFIKAFVLTSNYVTEVTDLVEGIRLMTARPGRRFT